MELLLIARYIRPRSDTLRQFHYKGRYQGDPITEIMLTDNENRMIYRNKNYLVHIDSPAVTGTILTGIITRLEEV